MNSQKRREAIVERIRKSEKPCSATSLANEFHVSRQIIVGDIALLRASGVTIIATPRGYVLDTQEVTGVIHTIAVSHQVNQLGEELYTIVDYGGVIIDVIVEHPVYGQLSGQLHISSRYDADRFLSLVKEDHVKPLSNLTDGLHLHTIQCKDEEVYKKIIEALDQRGFLYHE